MALLYETVKTAGLISVHEVAARRWDRTYDAVDVGYNGPRFFQAGLSTVAQDPFADYNGHRAHQAAHSRQTKRGPHRYESLNRLATRHGYWVPGMNGSDEI